MVGNMDVFITILTISIVILFLLVQLVVHRVFSQKNVIRLILVSYCITLLVSIFVCVGYILMRFIEIQSFSVWMAIGVSFFLGSLWILDYITGFFGLPISSLRIKLLSDIARAGDRGISDKKLLSGYNKKEIIAVRLDRLVRAGELVENKGSYVLTRGYSYLRLHAFMHRVLRRVYNG